MGISTAGECVIEKMLLFYSNPNFLRVILEIPHDGKHVSLRLLDHFVTNYTKNPDTRVWINKCDIYDDYKNMLNGYSKNLFDPFCRDERIVLFAVNDKGEKLSFENDRKQILKMKKVNLIYELRNNDNTYNDGIITTIAQLHFFSWCIQRNVIQYVLAHSTKIQDSMPKNNKKGQIKNKKIIYKKEMKFRIEF